MINLKNKNIILTGATGGIGNSIVDTLINLKAKLLVTGTNEKKLEELRNKYQDIVTIIKLTIRVLALAALLIYLICCFLGIIEIPDNIEFQMPFSE